MTNKNLHIRNSCPNYAPNMGHKGKLTFGNKTILLPKLNL